MLVTMLAALGAAIGLLLSAPAVGVKPADSGPPIVCGAYGGSPTIVCD